MYCFPYSHIDLRYRRVFALVYEVMQSEFDLFALECNISLQSICEA
jgi:hypothetical protein